MSASSATQYPEPATVFFGIATFPTRPVADRPGRGGGRVISSERTPQREREIADHPSLKPQSLLRRLVYAALPLGEGVIADPFMGSGSTIAACEAVGIQSIGVERHREYFELAQRAIKAASRNARGDRPAACL